MTTETKVKQGWKIEDGELIIYNEFINIEQADLDYQNEKMLRVYRSSPGALTFQLRSFCGIGEFGRGVKRNMNATVSLSFSEAKTLIEYLRTAIAKAESR